MRPLPAGWGDLGVSLESKSGVGVLRIYLSGRMTVEFGLAVLGPHDFSGQQGRSAFAYLVCARPGPVTRAELADALWGAAPPPSGDTALSAIVSKLRSVLSNVGLDGPSAIPTVGGCHELVLPPGSWVDHEVALDAIHEAESALRAGDASAAYGPSAVAHHIARRPFLPGDDAHWVERQRDRLKNVLVRALECRAEVYLWNGEQQLAVEAAREAVAMRPFRESGWRLLMRAHAAAGNGAEALRTYERCRRLIAEELGASPSPETRAVHTELLKRQ